MPSRRSRRTWLAEAEARFNTEIQRLQEEYHALTIENKATVDSIKASSLGLMTSILRYKNKQNFIEMQEDECENSCCNTKQGT
jgi:hypothetical protein